MDKEGIFSAFAGYKPEIKPVPVPEIGTTLYVRELDKDDDKDMSKELAEHEKAGTGFAWFACFAVCDEKGTRLFSEKDVNRVDNLPRKVLRRLWDVAAKLNGLTREAQEELEKNSTTPSTPS
ncbi:MAG: hypothetical protein IAF94_16795 [Pirellulaceae bacterium]|nr:hypothetical protein [Pirellulaceae bacterium]